MARRRPPHRRLVVADAGVYEASDSLLVLRNLIAQLPEAMNARPSSTRAR